MPASNAPSPITRNRSIPIQNKTLSAESVRHFAQIFEDEAAKVRQAGRNVYKNYVVAFQDGVTINNADPDVFSDSSLNYKSRPVRISMSFSEYDKSKSLRLYLIHSSDASSVNAVEISSDDEVWFNDVGARIEEAFGLLPLSQQPLEWFKRHRFIYTSIAAVGIGALTDFVETLIVYAILLTFKSLQEIKPPHNALIDWLASAPLPLRYWLNGWFPTLMVRQRVEAAWPNIELDLGPEHLRNERKQRTAIKWILSVVVAQVIITLFIEVYKAIH